MSPCFRFMHSPPVFLTSQASHRPECACRSAPVKRYAVRWNCPHKVGGGCGRGFHGRACSFLNLARRLPRPEATALAFFSRFSGVVGRSSTSPLAMSIMSLASWAGSRGLLARPPTGAPPSFSHLRRELGLGLCVPL